MRLSRRDFLKGATVFALTAGALGMSGLVFAEENGEEVVDVNVESSEELAAKFTAGKSGEIEYCAYDPTPDLAEVPDAIPLVVFLHGEDGKGENGVQLTANRGATFFMEAGQIAKNPCYVIAPQCPGDNWTDCIEGVKAMIDEYVAANDKIDKDRIYIEGMSMGGTGVWAMIQAYPVFFAAAIPMCGYAPEGFCEDIDTLEQLKNMPIWAFHNADDDVVPESETAAMAQALKDAGSGALQYEVYSAGSLSPAHNVWERVYIIGTPYNWMFAQNLARTDYGKEAPNMMFTHQVLKDNVTEVRDYYLGRMYIIDAGDEVLIIDSGMGGFGQADLYGYLAENVLSNPDAPIDILLTHLHGDHILGIPSLVASGNVRKTMIHPLDRAGFLETMDAFGVSEEQLNVVDVNEGDIVKIGDEEIEVVLVKGHTEGSICMFYKDYIFTGDAIGSGDLWLFGETTFEYYRPWVEHFMAEIAVRNKDYEILTGHFENLNPFTLQYVRDMVQLVKFTISGAVTPGIYTRRVGSYASYGEANIFFTGSIWDAEAEEEETELETE